MDYKVERAIILAAGRGKRLGIFTNEIPKPLLIYEDIPIIETIINNLHKKQIKEIYVVTGYKSIKFKYLIKKFGIKIINNKKWRNANNIVSVYTAKKYLSNCLIINGDAIMKKNVLSTIYKGSTMYADFCKKNSNEWELILDSKKEKVIKINTNGGKNILQHREITFICQNDVKKFVSKLYENIKFNKRVNDYFEFSLLESSDVYIKKVSYNCVFDIDNENDWKNMLKKRQSN